MTELNTKVRKVLLVIFIALVALALGDFLYTLYRESQASNLYVNASHVEEGMTENEVIQALGEPQKESWDKPSNLRTEISMSSVSKEKIDELEKRYRKLLKYEYSVNVPYPFSVERYHGTYVAIYFNDKGGEVVLRILITF